MALAMGFSRSAALLERVQIMAKLPATVSANRAEINEAFAASAAASAAATDTPDYTALVDYSIPSAAASEAPSNPLAAILGNPEMLAALKAMLTPATPSAAPTAKAITAPNAKAYNGGVPLNLRVVAVAPNPKKPGSASHARYNLYQVGLTLAETLAASPLGPTRADFLWDVRHGFIVLE